MRKYALLVVLFLATILILTTFAGATTLPLFPNARDLSAVAVAVDIRPASTSPIQPLRRGGHQVPYLVTADVRKSGGGSGVQLQPLTVYPGQEQVRSESAGGFDVKLIADISADGSHARTTVTVRRDGKLLTNQRASVWLAPQESTGPVQPVR